MHVRKNHRNTVSHGSEYPHAYYLVTHRLLVLAKTKEKQVMNEAEKEALSKILVALFLEYPRKRTQLQDESIKETHCAERDDTRKLPGRKKHGRQSKKA